ncbi:hypothetical protein TNCV_4300921 [Trichonephila clavipes]|nr:hypothetical protein TNCV_4300921 [Trichonephila clavipes]
MSSSLVPLNTRRYVVTLVQRRYSRLFSNVYSSDSQSSPYRPQWSTRTFKGLRQQKIIERSMREIMRSDNLNLQMKDDSWLHNEYINIVKDQIKENIVEECPLHFETNSYMPHSAVVRKDKETTKWFLMRL